MDQSFRYLTSEDLSNPHLFIVRFCHLDASIESIRHGILSLIKAASTKGVFEKYGDWQNYFYYQQTIIKLLEIAHVFHTRGEDFSITSEHNLYRPKNEWFGRYIDNHESMQIPSLYFRFLKDTEINNINLFFNDMFSFMDLESWIQKIDMVMAIAYADESFSETYDCGHLIVPILDYMEKLVESIFLIFHIRSIHYLNNQLKL